MAWESLYPEVVITDLKEDKKNAVKVEQFKVSDKAVYLPQNKYVPLEGVEKMQIRNSMMSTKGCCGLSFPVFNVILFHKDGTPTKLICEREVSANRIIEKISAAHPEIVFEEYIPPHKAQAASE